MLVFEVQSYVTLVVVFVLLAVSLFAFASSLMFSAESYEAAGKLTKPAWTIILGLGVAVQVLGFSFFLNLIATIAAFVYLADVRPAMAGLRRR